MKRANQQQLGFGGNCFAADEPKISKVLSKFVLRGGLVLLFFFLLNTSLPFGQSVGQSVTVVPQRFPSRGGRQCKELPIRSGDSLIGNAAYSVGPGEGSPNIAFVRVYANEAAVFSADINGNESRNISITVEAPKVKVCIEADRIGYDSDDSAYVTLSIGPRPNLSALPATVRSDGSVSYGYRVGNRAWHPRGHYIPVELFYYNQNNPSALTPIAAHGMQLPANSSQTFVVASSQLPTVPQEATHLLVWVDRANQIPEDNELDNLVIIPLPKPNLLITEVSYDDSNRIKVGFRFDSLLPVIPPSVQLKLNYAKGTHLSDVISSYPALREKELTGPDLIRNANNQVYLNVGDYMLPTSDATYLLASIDLPDNRVAESNENDNVKTQSVRLAPGYTRLTVGRGSGVAVYEKGGYFVTVVDMNKATLASSLKTWFGFGISYHFNKGLLGNTGRRFLKVAVNGTFFQAPLGGTLPLPVSPSSFYYGLKHNGKFVNKGSSVPINGSSDYSISLFTFNRNSVATLPHQAAPFYNSSYKTLIGSISDPIPPPQIPVSRSDSRNVAGFRDPIRIGEYGERRFRTLVLFLTKNRVTLETVRTELRQFGVETLTQFDAGASTALMVANGNKGSKLITSARPLPHAILIYSGQQPRRAAQLVAGASPVVDDDTLPVTANVVAIQKNGTQSNRTEFSVLAGDGEFANIFNHLATAFYSTDDNFQFLLADWDLDRYADLIAVKKQFTGTRRTEIHIVSGATGYSKFIFQIGTGLHETDSQWKFALADWDGDHRPDLFCIRRAGGASGRVEVHVLSAASNYQQFILNTPTALQYTADNFDFHIADWDGDTRPDLFAIKKNQTGAGRTEVHIAPGASNFGSFILQTGTALHETDSTWSFAVTDWDGGGKVDLVGFKKLNTGTNSTEIHVVQGETQFQNFILQIGTALPNTGQETELLLADNADIGDYDPLAKRYAYTEDGVYLFRNDEILRYTGAAPTGWEMLDKNPTTSAVVSTSDSFFQIQLPSGAILKYDSTNNSWQTISTDSNNIAIAATSEGLYSLKRSGVVLKYTGTGWTLISQDSLTRAIVATDEGLFQMHTTGRILRWDGNSWVTVSTSYSTRQIVATQDDVFALRNTGEVLVYTGSDWQGIGNDTNTVSISTDGETIYRRLANGQVFRYYGQPMTGWKLVDWQ